MKYNKDFGNGVLWAVVTILLAMLWNEFLFHNEVNPGIVLGTLICGLYWRFKK